MTEVIVEQTSKAEFLNPWSFLGVKNGSLEDMSALLKNRIITHPRCVLQYMPPRKVPAFNVLHGTYPGTQASLVTWKVSRDSKG